MKTIILIVYLVIGVVVASMKDYLGDVGSIGDILNLVLAVLLWPLVLLGVEFNLDIGGGEDKGNGKEKNGNNGKGSDKKEGALLLVGPAFAYARAATNSVLRRSRR